MGIRKLRRMPMWASLSGLVIPMLWSITLPAAGQTAPTTPVIRHGGDTGAEVAAAIAVSVFPHGAPSAVLVSADGLPDAVVAAALLTIDGPLLLSESGSEMGSAAATALEMLGVRRVVLVGRVASDSSPVAGDLMGEGYEVERVKGADRYETAARVLQRLHDHDRVTGEAILVASDPSQPQLGFPDAIAIAPLGAADAIPILLTAPSRLPEATRQALAQIPEAPVLLVGGQRVIAESVAADISALDHPTRRLSGDGRYATSLFADEEYSGRTDRRGGSVWMTAGNAGAEALAGAAAAARSGDRLLLTDGGDLLHSPITTDALIGLRTITTSYHLVGNEGAISDLTADELHRLPQATAPIPDCVALLDSMRERLADVILEGAFADGPSVRIGDRNKLFSPARFEVERYVKGSGPTATQIQTAYQQGSDGTISHQSPAIEPEAGERWRIFGLSNPDIPQGWATSPCDGSVRLE